MAADGRRLVTPALLFLLAAGAVAAEIPDESEGLQAVRAELDDSVDELRRGTRMHNRSAIGGVLFLPIAPAVLPIGTVGGSITTLDAAEEYRETVKAEIDYDPLPPLRGMRALAVSSAALYALGEVALLYLLFSALDPDPPRYGSRELNNNIGSGILIGSFLLGLTGTSIATWRAHNTTLEYHRTLW